MRIVTHAVGDGGASLTGYLLDGSQEYPNIQARPGVLVFPGGGYAFCSDREAEPIAMAYLAQGFHAFVLRYSVDAAKNTFSAALAEAEAALALLRGHAADYALDPQKIAAAGFSAGGHLAACLGAMAAEKPNALILGYPVILAQWGKDFGRALPGADAAVTPDTPPAFVFSTQADKIVPIENSLAFCTALAKAGVPFEEHIYLRGIHGVSLGIAATSGGKAENLDPDMAAWLPMSVRFLQNLWGDFSMFPPEASGADRPWIEHPVSELLQNPMAAAVLEGMIPGISQNILPGMNISLRRMAQFSQGQITEEMLRQAENQLAVVMNG